MFYRYGIEMRDGTWMGFRNLRGALRFRYDVKGSTGRIGLVVSINGEWVAA